MRNLGNSERKIVFKISTLNFENRVIVIARYNLDNRPSCHAVTVFLCDIPV